MEDERTIDELIEIAEEIPEKLGLAEGMAGLRGTAAGEHVSVTVDVQGKLVGLEIGEDALRQTPEALAAEISRLSASAGNAVLRKGIDVLRAGTTPAIAEAIREQLGITEEPAEAEELGESTSDATTERRPAPPDDEEFFTLQRA
ncbi:hypothetical protein FPZ12_045075 [Amycolatopsis acidicola]|uniref:YbaB/EbfC family nucleoid-associated protein n=1 Tax=Amycolatopsis acidicola TaxID=2596893 RepID=A0A5N0ULN4_9PSEU|nr:hypothetical protein [Amycolatopsis acidicola]KAA9148164.1 hypothetical protein FPZ12_045075 [Amycolatopsis acidicola]